MMRSNKGVFGPAMGIIFLVLVCVIATISFSNWYSGFDTAVRAETENRSENIQITLQAQIHDTLYIHSTARTLLTDFHITNRDLEVICTLLDISPSGSFYLQEELNVIDISACRLLPGMQYNVLIISDDTFLRATFSTK